MKRTSIWFGLLLSLAVLALGFGARSAPPTSAPTEPQASGGEPAYLNCTVRSVDLKARTVEVITGVGYALRQYRMSVAPACEISVGGSAADLGKLRPGTIVRVRYQPVPAGPKAPARLMATAIETVRFTETGGVR
jgi:hypothetical protein